MPKRTGPKKGHKCAEGFDNYCQECWDRRLKVMHLTEFAGADTNRVTFCNPQDMEGLMGSDSEDAGYRPVVGSRPRQGEEAYSGEPDIQENKSLLNHEESDT